MLFKYRIRHSTTSGSKNLCSSIGKQSFNSCPTSVELIFVKAAAKSIYIYKNFISLKSFGINNYRDFISILSVFSLMFLVKLFG